MGGQEGKQDFPGTPYQGGGVSTTKIRSWDLHKVRVRLRLGTYMRSFFKTLGGRQKAGGGETSW